MLTGSRQKSAKDRRAGDILESSRMMLKKAPQESCNNKRLLQWDKKRAATEGAARSWSCGMP